MSEWKPMKDCPVDTRVEVGRYDEWRDVTEWKTTAGTPFRSCFFGLFKKAGYYAEEYSHWRFLPAPPEGDSK